MGKAMENLVAQYEKTARREKEGKTRQNDCGPTYFILPSPSQRQQEYWRENAGLFHKTASRG